MSQERPTSNPNTEHPGGSTHVFPSTLQPVGQAPRVPAEEASTILPTPNRYWRLFNDPGLAPPDPGLSPITRGLGPPVVTTEAFLGLTQQVRTLTGMIQTIVPCIPQLAQAPMHQHPHIPRQTLQQEAPQSRPSQGEHPGGAPHPPIEATIENPIASVSQQANRSRDVIRLLPEPDVVSSDSTNSTLPDDGMKRKPQPHLQGVNRDTKPPRTRVVRSLPQPRMIGYPMGRSDSSKPTPDGQPQQHFGGSHVSPRDQVDSRSSIRGGGDWVRHSLAPRPLM
ncbi:hypothetical protein BHM03_00021296 [Ensete ventricosum]|nr:hypothetical protein BHM03_00021296 [Ensete ventricosum]